MFKFMYGYFQNSEIEMVFYNGNIFRSIYGFYKCFFYNFGGGFFGKVIIVCYKNMNLFNIDRREYMFFMIFFIL